MKKYSGRIPIVRYNKNIEITYKQAIEQNRIKRDIYEVDSAEWKEFNENIIKLEKELAEVQKERKETGIPFLDEYNRGETKFFEYDVPIRKVIKKETTEYGKRAEEIFKKILEDAKKVKPPVQPINSEKTKEPKEEQKKQEQPKQPKQQEQKKQEEFKNSNGRRVSTRDLKSINRKVDKLISEAERDIEAKYRGNKELNRRYDLAYKRYKSNIVEREFTINANGKFVKGDYKTVKDYKEKDEDEKILGFSEYKDTLERVTKAEAGRKYGLKLYAEYSKDKEYLKTNNYTYSEYNTTRENLKTLGYFGRKSRLHELKEGQNIRNAVRVGMNISGFVRNHTVVPVSTIIGEKIAVRIYDFSYNKLFKDKNKVYNNRRTHRYEARKKYHLSQGKGYIKAVYNSILKAKETDEQILEDKKQEVRKQYEEYRENLLNAKNKTERRNIRKPSINTDAISLETHNERNKKNVTRVITGIKAVTIAGLSYVGPKISKAIIDQTTHNRILTTKSVGKDQIIQTQEWVKGKDIQVIDRQAIENLKIRDLMDSTDKTVASFAGGPENEVVQGSLDYIRGIAEGKLSLLDGKNVDISGFATGRVSDEILNKAGNINMDTNILDLIAMNRNQVLGTNSSKEQILDEILKSGTTEQKMQKLQEMFDGIHVSKSTSGSGIPTGWDSLGNEFSSIKEKLVKTIEGEGHWQTVTKTIKGKTVESIQKIKEENKVIKAILSGAGKSLKAVRMAEIVDLVYENTRTNKKEKGMGER